jgi:hypothetical protein
MPYTNDVKLRLNKTTVSQLTLHNKTMLNGAYRAPGKMNAHDHAMITVTITQFDSCLCTSPVKCPPAQYIV